MVDYNRLNLNNIYKQWLQNQIETANAKGLLGNDTAMDIIKKNLVSPIDDILNNAKRNLANNIKRGTLPGGYQQMLKDTMPKSNNFINQQTIEDYVNNMTKGFANGGNVKAPSTTNSALRSGYRQMLIDTAPKVVGPDNIDDIAETMTKNLLNVRDIGKKTFVKKAGQAATAGALATKLPKLGNPWVTAGITAASFGIPMLIDWMKNRGNDIDSESNGEGDSANVDNSSNNNKKTTNVNTKSTGVNEVATQQVNTTRDINQPKITTPENEDIINNYISRLQGINRPYIDALESYLNNYYKNLDQARRADLYFYGANLAKGLDPRAGQKFNPLQNQMDIVNIIKALQDAKASDMSSIDELAGNIAIANEMELPPQAAFANKNLLTALSQAKRYATDLEKARIVDAMRRYGYDRAYSRAIDQQKLRNQGNANTAMIYMGGSEPGIGLTPQGTAQPKGGGLAGDFAQTK